MRLFLRAAIVTGLAIIFTGMMPLTVTLAAALTASDACAKPSHACAERSFTKCYCLDELHGTVPLSPATDQTSRAKAQSSAAALALVPVFAAPSSLGPDLYPPVTRRAGPPVSLSLLHASLLL